MQKCHCGCGREFESNGYAGKKFFSVGCRLSHNSRVQKAKKKKRDLGIGKNKYLTDYPKEKPLNDYGFITPSRSKKYAI